MQTSQIYNYPSTSNIPVLKSANQQLRLAGQLITASVKSLQRQTTQSPAQPADGKGIIINIKA